MSLRPPLHVSTFHSRTVVSMLGRLCHLFVHALSSLQVANAQCMTLRSLAPCLRAAREKHRFAAGKKHRNGKKHVWQQEKNALQREKAVSAAGKNASKKCRFAAGKIQSSRKNTLQQHKSTFAAEKMDFGGSGKKPSEAGKNSSEARKKPAEAGKKPAAEKVQLCNSKSCRNGKNTFPQREKAAARAPRDARAYIRPLGSAHCPTPATQKRLSSQGRQGVHQTPWQCTLSHACHAKEAEPQGTPGRTSDPFAVQIVPRTPATQKRRSPKGRQGIHQTAWQYTLSLGCHAKEAEPQETPGRTSDPLAVHIVPRLPRKRGGAPRDARAYIRPLGSAHCPTPATQKRRSPKKRQGIHQTPGQCTLSLACHAKETEPQGTPGRTSDPQTVHIVPRLPHKRG